ncbi:MAG: O-antigen ligase family protein [Bacteroidetes bacterium]|nr:O-antigen ligase family protein [Bacteroidota bacterium]
MVEAEINTANKRQQIHFWIYFVGLCLFVVSIPTSPYMITVSQIIIGLNWIAEGRFNSKMQKFLDNKPAVVFSLIYFLFVVGLLWTNNYKNAFQNDLLHKLPTFTLTLFIVSSKSLKINQIRFLILMFIASVLTVSFIGTYNLLFADLATYRYILPYGSHIYYSLMLIMSAFMLPWIIKQITDKKKFLILSLVLSIWMIIFLFLLRSLSGIASLSGVFVFMVIWFVFKIKNLAVRITITVVFLLVIVSSTFVFNYIYEKAANVVHYEFEKLETHTAEGNEYVNDTTKTLRENGHLVFIYISEVELREEWNAISEIDFNGKTSNQQILKYNLYRYMASKGFKKDREHFKLLEESDIRAIEDGVPNYLYVNWPGIFQRIHQTIAGTFIFKETQNPEWSTFAQRIDLWQASITAIKKYPVIGWGTGDLFEAVQFGLVENGSYYYVGQDVKPHNQFLLILISLGFVGLLLFIGFYTFTVVKSKGYKVLYFNIFLVAYGINMFGNNPIDAQLGQSLFVFFTVLFCFLYPRKNDEKVF